MPQIHLLERVLGVTDIADPNLAMAQAHLTLTGEPMPEPIPPIYLKRHEELTNADAITYAYLGHKRISAMIFAGELLVHGAIQNNSSLTDWHNYHHLIKDHGTRLDGGNALMVGSLNSLSARSFRCLAEDVYGADQTFIIDPSMDRDQDEHQHGHYIMGSGLNSPFASGSMDVVHTNRLILSLRDPRRPERSNTDQVIALAWEIARVLKPGGQVFMTETVPGAGNKEISKEQLKEYAAALTALLADVFARLGMDSVTIESGRKSENIEWLLDPTQNFNNHTFPVNPKTLLVYARKRLRTTTASGGSIKKPSVIAS